MTRASKLCPETLRYCARVLTNLSRAHLQSERNLHDIPEAVALHRTIRLAHEHAAEIFAGEAGDVRRARKRQKAGKR